MIITNDFMNRFLWTLGMTESKNNDEAWGDKNDNGYQAMGRWQVHPSWLWTWSRTCNIQPTLVDSWDSFVERVLENFVRYHSELNAHEIAMTFHLGHIVREGAPEWDIAYYDRFIAMWAIYDKTL